MGLEIIFNPVTGETTEVEYDPPAISLAEAKVAKWEAVKAIRDAGKNGGADVPFIGRVDTDAESRGLINGAVSMALVAASAGQPFSMTWTLADNAEAALDGPKMIAVGVAAGNAVGAWHGRGQVLRAEIEDAADVEAVDAIDITVGWPA